MVLDPNEAHKPTQVGEAERQGQIRKAAFASVVGTSIEWYDFFLYGTASALIFPDLFFPESSSFAGTLESFATLAVGFAARPVGAAIFGHWGDRIGRKATLIITLLLMGISTALIGLLPGTGSIGLMAPVLLVFLRLVQGLAVGGEWSGSVLLAMEWGDQKKRGQMGSWAQIGVPVGLILGTGGLSLLSATISPEAFHSWGWRVPFLASLIMVAIGLYVRLKILETPMFAAVVKSKKTAKLPVVEVIKRHPKEILLAAGARFAEQMPFYVFTTFVLTYVVDEVKMSETFALNAVMVAAAIELFTLPFFSRLSDRIGRKKVYIAGILGVAVYGFIYFGLLNTGSAALVFIGIVFSLAPHDAMYGPQAALIAESFPTGLRYAGAGIGYQLASVFAGGPAPLVAAILLEKFGTGYAISVFILFSCVVSYACVKALPDRSRADITDDSVYERAPATAAPTG